MVGEYYREQNENYQPEPVARSNRKRQLTGRKSSLPSAVYFHEKCPHCAPPPGDVDG
jgi:hypothetical protein